MRLLPILGLGCLLLVGTARAQTSPWPVAPYQTVDWAERVDLTWGAGRPAEIQTAHFLELWNAVDAGYACFGNLDLDWDALRDRLLPEVQAGVSKGRFLAIVSEMMNALHDPHTVCLTSQYDTGSAYRGYPLLRLRSIGLMDAGVGLAPLPDRSLLVYAAQFYHPLLDVGDVVLGFDGDPWHEIYPRLLAAGVPVTGLRGSSPGAWEHYWLASACENWHLFATIDVLYWDSQAAGDFAAAVATYVRNPVYEGLILDFRYNLGGNMFMSNNGLSMLFTEQTDTILMKRRCGPGPSDLCVSSGADVYDIPSNPSDGWRHPIAVLVGPQCWSAGDQVAYRLKLHPRARFFGKTTCGSFNAPSEWDTSYPTWSFRYSIAEAFPVHAVTQPLSHRDMAVDEPVWHNAADAVAGRDAVVERALAWFTGTTATEDEEDRPPAVLQDRLRHVRPNPANPGTEVAFTLADPGMVEVVVVDPRGRRMRTLASGPLPRGEHLRIWDGHDDDGRAAPSGVYLVRLVTDTGWDVRRLTLVR